VPESFKVLIKEMQALGLDVKILAEDAREIEIRESDDDVAEAARDYGLDVSVGAPVQPATSRPESGSDESGEDLDGDADQESDGEADWDGDEASDDESDEDEDGDGVLADAEGDDEE
jgi:DNA-directed RNA polymerase subunit beta